MSNEMVMDLETFSHDSRRKLLLAYKDYVSSIEDYRPVTADICKNFLKSEIARCISELTDYNAILTQLDPAVVKGCHIPLMRLHTTLTWYLFILDPNSIFSEK